MGNVPGQLVTFDGRILYVEPIRGNQPSTDNRAEICRQFTTVIQASEGEKCKVIQIERTERLAATRKPESIRDNS
jgi:hypothetical protein